MISDDDEENKTTDDIDETQTSGEGDINESKATATAAPHTRNTTPSHASQTSGYIYPESTKLAKPDRGYN